MKKSSASSPAQRYLFVFAHPDDESIACAATMHQLLQRGDDVKVVLATRGQAGEVMQEAAAEFAEVGDLGELRTRETHRAMKAVGVKDVEFLNYQDGEITNQVTWGKLKEDIIAVIEAYRPDVVVTFDHTGWYYHLDHVAVSIATTWAVRESIHRPQALLLSYVRVKDTHWPYAFLPTVPVTHVVDATPHKELKLQTLTLHASQKTDAIEQKIHAETPHFELFQLVPLTEGFTFVDHAVFLPAPAGVEW